MRFQRIGTRLAGMAAFGVVVPLLFSLSLPVAAEDELPPPGGFPPAGEAAPLPDAAPAAPPLDANLAAPPVEGTAPLPESLPPAGEDIPSPSLGGDDLPPPGGEGTAEGSGPPAPVDDIYLPPPSGGSQAGGGEPRDSLSQTPAVPAPVPSSSSDDYDWRRKETDRPLFSLYTGLGFKGYSSGLVDSARATGPLVGASLRLVSLGQMLFLHAYGDLGWYATGYAQGFDPSLAGGTELKETSLHMGGMVELGVGRHLSAFGSLLRRQSLGKASDEGPLHEEPAWFLGLGFQWDFYVIPHGSLGLHGHIEQDLFAVSLTMALEPAPRKKMNLNFNEM